MQHAKEIIIKQYNFNLLYASRLVEDIPEQAMTIVSGKGIENHPAFTLGHLLSGSAMLAEDLGGQFIMPEGWAELFVRMGPAMPGHLIQIA